MGGPTAFDFAVTAPQRRDVLLDAGRGGGSAAAAYADVKRRHLDTAAVCEQHGVAFVPFPVLVPSTKFLHCSYPFMLRADIWSACTGYASVVFLLALPVAVLGVCRASLAFVHPSLTFDLQLILSVHHES